MRPPQRSSLLIPAVTLMVIILGTGAAMAAALAQAEPVNVRVPKLKPVPKVVHSTTKKKPPKNVRFRGQPTAGITTGTGTATGGAGDVIIAGVPGYKWRDGCGPTAIGMIVGYYDLHGWDDLILGDSTWSSPEVQQVIASRGTADTPGNYEDYALPLETYPNVMEPDKSEAPVGDEHQANCIADYMHTSWSADGLSYGYSYSNMASAAFVGFVKSRYPSSLPTVTTYAGPNLTWDIVKREVDAARPMGFLVDCTGDGVTDHFVSVVGYRETNGYPEYGCWDTWNVGLIRWQRFRSVSSAYQWGVWGGYTFSMGGATTVTPTPTTSATPTPTTPPLPSNDTLAPSTTQTGADDTWHNKAVTVTLSAADDSSGVAYTEYSLDAYGWVRGTTVTVPAPTKAGVVHTLAFRSVDNAGNVEAEDVVQIKIDTISPATSSNADGKLHAGSFTLTLTGKDAHAGVATTYFSIDGGAYQTGSSILVRGAGRHSVKFYSVDNARNIESIRSATVRIG